MTDIKPFIVWGPSLVTGVANIDEQHKVLVDMCNEAHHLVETHASTEKSKKLLRDLMSYALYHFEAEEEIAMQCGYALDQVDQNAVHRTQHREFAKVVADMQLEMTRGNGISTEGLFEFLRSWLTDHILGMDMKLAAYVNARPQEKL